MAGGGNPQLAIKITANIEALKAALQLTQTELMKTASGAAAISGQFSGAKLEQQALQTAVAIKALGGAATLSATEAKKADTIFTQWFEKAAKTGKDIPADLKKIADETRQVAKATEEVAKATEQADAQHKSWFATIAGGTAAGQLLAEGLVKAGEMAIDVFKEVAHWLAEIAMEGSRELGIEKAFTRLTTGAGQDGVKLLRDLQAGTHHTVEESALMIRVNENLAAGMKLTNDQYTLMAKGAFALAKATGSDVKEGLDKMSDAMLTGRTRALALTFGKIDAKDAEEKFAAALGRTAQELTAEGKLEAVRQEILRVVGNSVDRLGEQTEGLGTKVAQARTMWKDFQDELGKVVAGSPVLMTLLNNIGEVLAKSFGVAKEEAIKRLGMAIDQLAISLVGVAAAVAPVVGAIGTEFNAIQVLFRDVMQVVDLTLLGIKAVALGALEAADYAMPGDQFADQQKRLRSEMAALVIAIDERKAALAEDKKAEDEWWNLGERMQAQLSQLQAKMEASRRTFKEHKDVTTEHAAAAEADAAALNQNTAAFFNGAKGADEHAKKVKAAIESGRELATTFATMFARGATGEEMFKALGGGAAGLQKTFDALAMEVPADFKWIVDAFREMGEQIEADKTIEAAMKNLGDFNRKTLEQMVKDTETLAGKQRESLNKAFIGNLDIQIKAQNDLAKLEGDSLEKRLGLVRADMQARRTALDENASNYESSLATINKLEEESAREATEAWLDHVAQLKKAMGPSFLDIFNNALKGIPDIITAAFTGGGGVGGAISGVLSDLGGQLGTKLGGMLARGLDGILGKLGPKIGGAIFDMIPGIGGALGSMIMPALDKAWGWISKREGRQVNDLRDAYVAAAGGFDKLAEQARKAGIELNSSSAFQRASTTEAWQKAVAELDAALKKSTEDRKKMLAAVMAGERLATQSFITEMENLAAAGGEAAKEATDYFNATLKTAASGLTAMFAGLEKGATSAAQAAAVKLHMAAGMTEADAKKAAEGITGIFVKTQAQATGLAGAIAGTFSKMMQNGASFREALAAIKGPLDTMRKQLEMTGLSGGAAFENLSRMGQIADGQITGPLMDAIDGANQALIGLSNSGLMNQETFAALATTATDAYNQIIAQGVDGQAAMQMMQPTLQTLWEMQQQFGYEVDASTQAMIDEAAQAGLVGEAHMSAAERTAKSMEKVATIMEAVARKMGVDLPAAAESGARRIDSAFETIDPSIPEPWADWSQPPTVTIPYEYEATNEPTPPGEYAHGGIVYAAAGWTPKGTDTVPAMLTPGERVLTVAQNAAFEKLMDQWSAALNLGMGGHGSEAAINNLLAKVQTLIPQAPGQAAEPPTSRRLPTLPQVTEAIPKTVAMDAAQAQEALRVTLGSWQTATETFQGLWVRAWSGGAESDTLQRLMDQLAAGVTAAEQFKSGLESTAVAVDEGAKTTMLALIEQWATLAKQFQQTAQGAGSDLGADVLRMMQSQVASGAAIADKFRASVNSVATPAAFAEGGVVYAAEGWAPKGTDTVPAMLTPGERVLSVAQNKDFEAMLRAATATLRGVPQVKIDVDAGSAVGTLKILGNAVANLVQTFKNVDDAPIGSMLAEKLTQARAQASGLSADVLQKVAPALDEIVRKFKAPEAPAPWAEWREPKFEIPPIEAQPAPWTDWPMPELPDVTLPELPAPWAKWVPPPDISDEIQIPEIPAPWESWPEPPDLGPYAHDFTPGYGEGPPPEIAWGGEQAAGGSYLVSRPTMFMAGEAGAERVTFAPQAAATPPAAAPAPAPVNITIQALDPIGLKKVVENEVVPLLVSAYRRNVNGARTETRKELVE